MVIYNDIREVFPDEINWEFWDKLVEKTRKEIAEALKDYHEEKPPIFYLYNQEGELVKQFNTKKDCAKFLGGSETTIRNYLIKQWIFKGYLLSQEELRKDIAFAIYRSNLEHGNVYLEGSTQKKIPIYSYNQEGKLVGAYESKNQWAKSNNRAASLLNNGDRIIDGRLVSVNKYTENKAKTLYNDTQVIKPRK